MTYARCPRCRSTLLSIIETREEIGQTDFARHKVSGDAIYAAGDFWFNYGEPLRVELECGDCGHLWRSRRVVGAQVEAP